MGVDLTGDTRLVPGLDSCGDRLRIRGTPLGFAIGRPEPDEEPGPDRGHAWHPDRCGHDQRAHVRLQSLFPGPGDTRDDRSSGRSGHAPRHSWSRDPGPTGPEVRDQDGHPTGGRSRFHHHDRRFRSAHRDLCRRGNTLLSSSPWSPSPQAWPCPMGRARRSPPARSPRSRSGPPPGYPTWPAMWELRCGQRWSPPFTPVSAQIGSQRVPRRAKAWRPRSERRPCSSPSHLRPGSSSLGWPDGIGRRRRWPWITPPLPPPAPIPCPLRTRPPQRGSGLGCRAVRDVTHRA